MQRSHIYMSLVSLSGLTDLLSSWALVCVCVCVCVCVIIMKRLNDSS